MGDEKLVNTNINIHSIQHTRIEQERDMAYSSLTSLSSVRKLNMKNWVPANHDLRWKKKSSKISQKLFFCVCACLIEKIKGKKRNKYRRRKKIGREKKSNMTIWIWKGMGDDNEKIAEVIQCSHKMWTWNMKKLMQDWQFFFRSDSYSSSFFLFFFLLFLQIIFAFAFVFFFSLFQAVRKTEHSITKT